MTFTMIELFAGIGGGSAAAEQVVDPATKHPLFRPILAAEIDSDARIFFKANFPETRLEGDIKKIEEIPLDAHILVAGPPCQSFSLAGKKEGFSGKSGEGFEIFINFIKRAKPQIILFENVKDITSTKYLPTIEKKFKEAGYDIKLAKFNSLDFGMPQHRVRVYIVAVRSNLPLSSKLKTFSFPKPKYSSKEKLISPLYFALEDLTNRPQKDDTNKLAHEIISEHLKAIVKNEERKEEIEERKEEKRVDDNHVLSDKKGNTRVINTKNTVGAQLYSRFYGAGGGKLVVGPDEKKDAAPSKTSDPKSKITLRFTEIAGPAPTLTQINPIIGMLGRRMIGRELANIQGFPTTYKIPVSFRN